MESHGWCSHLNQIKLTVPKPNVRHYTSQLWKEQSHTPTLYVWLNVKLIRVETGRFSSHLTAFTPFARQPETEHGAFVAVVVKDIQECQLENIRFESRKGWSHYRRLYKYFSPSMEKCFPGNGLRFRKVWGKVRFERMYQECAATTPASVFILRSNWFRPHLPLLLPLHEQVLNIVWKSRGTEAFFCVITRVFKGESDTKSCNLWLPVHYRM